MRYLLRIASLAILGLLVLSAACFASPSAEPRFRIVPIIAHSSAVNSVAISADGARIASSASDESVKLWDVRTGRLLWTTRSGSPVYAVAFIPDASRLILKSDKRLDVLDTTSGTMIGSLANGSTDITAMMLSRDGSRVAVGRPGGTIQVWEVASGRLLRTLVEPKGGPNATGYIDVVQMSPDGTQLLSASTFEPIRLWDIESGRLLRSFTRPNQYTADAPSAQALAFSPDGRRFAAAGPGYPLTVWDVSGQKSRALDRSAYSINALAFSPQGDRILAGNEERGARVWSVATGTALFTLNGVLGSIDTVAYSADGRWAVSGGSGKAVHLWEAGTGRLVRRFGDGATPIEQIVAGTDQVLAASDSVRFWDLSTGTLVRSLPKSEARSLALSPDGSRLLSIGEQARLWDAKTGVPVWTFRVPDKEQRAVAGTFGPGDALILSEDVQGRPVAKVWDPPANRLVRTLRGAEGIGLAAFSPDRRRLLTATPVSNENNGIRLWDLETGRLLRRLLGHTHVVQALTFSPDGARAVSGGSDKKIFFWDLASGKALRSFLAHDGDVRTLTYAHDGSRLASGGADTVVRLWDAVTGQPLRKLGPPDERATGAVMSVAFSGDDRRVLSGGEDGTVRVWDAASGDLLATCIAAANGEWLTITPEGFFAASEKGGDLLSVVNGLEVWSIDQFFQALYRPDLVREKMVSDPRGVVRAAAARLDLRTIVTSGSAPEPSIRSPSDGADVPSATTEVAVEILDRGGGIGRVEWRVNGVTLGLDRIGTDRSPVAGGVLRLTRPIALGDGDNVVEVVAYNASDLVASQAASVRIVARQASPAPGRLFLLAVGVDAYADERIRLALAVADAKAVVTAIGKAATALFAGVDVTTLFDTAARRESIDRAFAGIAARMRPGDTFLFYLAGHGKTENGRYFFIPQDFRLGSALAASAISQEQLQAWFALIPARRSILLFDTCESGSLAGEQAIERDLADGAAAARLQRATGRTIMSAAAADQDALEGFRNHGLFTYALLDGLGRADADDDGRVDVAELAAYIYANVVNISLDTFHRRQVPQIRLSGGNYALARPVKSVPEEEPGFVIPLAATHRSHDEADILVQPVLGAARVSQLRPGTPVRVVQSRDGFDLIARQGRPIGFVTAGVLQRLQ